MTLFDEPSRADNTACAAAEVASSVLDSIFLQREVRQGRHVPSDCSCDSPAAEHPGQLWLDLVFADQADRAIYDGMRQQVRRFSDKALPRRGFPEFFSGLLSRIYTQERPAAVISLRWPLEELMRRYLAVGAGIPRHCLEAGDLAPWDLERMQKLVARMNRVSVTLYREHSNKWLDLWLALRRLDTELDLQAIVVVGLEQLSWAWGEVMETGRLEHHCRCLAKICRTRLILLEDTLAAA